MDLSLRRLALPFVLLPGVLPLALGACSQGYSPNTYASNAAQVEANVARGVIIGVRQVLISPDGTIGAATGGAAGGVAGSQVPGAPVVTALGAIGGTLVGGIGGAAAAQAAGKTKGWEYIVQEDGNKLVSVTQTSKTALGIGLHVLVIAGSQQARIVPDYTVQLAAAAAPAKPPQASQNKTLPASGAAPATEINLTPYPPAGSPVLPPAAPLTVVSDPATPAPATSPQTPPPGATPPNFAAAATP